MMATELPLSLVTSTQRPSGEARTPSGSRPTAILATTRPRSTSSTLSRAASSSVTNSECPSRLISTRSGSETPFSSRVCLSVAVSMTATPSACRSRGSLAHRFSGIGGGHLGSPVSATYRLAPSGLSTSPLGRLPTVTVASAVSRCVSMTVTVPSSSLET